MSHNLYLIRSPQQIAFFSAFVMPEILPRLEEPTFFLAGAVENGQPVGAAVLEVESDRAHLHSIAVAEDRRRNGIGSALLRHSVRALRQLGIGALCAVLLPEEAEAAALFAAFGMQPSSEAGSCYRFMLGDIAGHEVLRGPVQKAIPLEDLPNMSYHEYISKTFPAGLSDQRSAFDPKLSHGFVENGRITACLLTQRSDDSLSIGWMSSSSQDKLALLYLLRAAFSAALISEPPETAVHFTAFDLPVIHLADKLLDGKAEKFPIRQWELSGRRFRLIDTTSTGWEESKHG